MAKTRAQIHKEFRERKKATGGKTYLEMESARVKEYYVPSTQLSKKKLLKRREDTRRRVQRHREKKAQRESLDAEDSPESLGSIKNSERPSTSGNQLTVRLRFNGPHKKKKNNAGIAQTLKKKLRELETKNKELTRSNWRLAK